MEKNLLSNSPCLVAFQEMLQYIIIWAVWITLNREASKKKNEKYTPQKIPWDQMLGNICTFWNLKCFFKNSSMEDTCFICIIVVYSSSWFSPYFADLLFLSSGCFFIEGSRIGNSHFALGKGQNITVCEKYAELTREPLFILCSSTVFTSSAVPSSPFVPLGTSQSTQSTFERFEFIPFNFYEEKVLEKQRKEPQDL